MYIFYSPASPFVRKCLVTADELGCYDKITLMDCNAHPVNRDQTIIQKNPLGQVPTLVTEQEDSLFDSKVICEYLNQKQNGHLFGNDTNKWQILKEHAIADGIMTTAVLLRIEKTMRPAELEWTDLSQGHADKIETSLRYFENHPENLDSPINIVQITLACALTYIDFRLPQLAWRERFHRLDEWLAKFNQRPSMQKTGYANKK